jgi:hypothetical protein
MTVKVTAWVFTASILASSLAIAQSPPFPPQPAAPSTRLEAFIGTRGEMVVKDFYELGAFTGQIGSMKIDALVAYQPGQEQQRVRGLRIAVTSGGRIENTETAFLDIEEVESLSSALAYMADAEQNKKGNTSLTIVGSVVGAPPYTEFEFSTKDDLRIGFYRRLTETGGFASSGRINPARVFFKPSEFLAIKSIVDKGLTILKSR